MSDPETEIDARFASFLGSLGAGSPIAPAARRAVAQHTLEIGAAMLAGADIPEMRPVLHACGQAPGKVAVPATPFRSEPSIAAGAAAALAHAAELDPIHAGAIVCPAAVTIPAALALAQTVEVSGPRYIAAVSAGYEAAIRLGRALDGAALLAQGWWPTAVCGAFGAAATSALCLGLDEEPLRNALGLAAVHCGGLTLGGSTAPAARNLLCAHTVRTGVAAALAAADGVAGPRGLFSGPRSLLGAFGRSDHAAAISDHLGERWAVLETSLKRWPCALQAQSALDALEGLASGREREQPVQSVEIRLPAPMQRIVDHPAMPATRWAAAASLQFLAAALLLDGDILEARMEETGRRDPVVRELMQRIHVSGDPSLDDRYPRELPARVSLRSARGEARAECSRPPGHPERPLSFAASETRFRRYAAGRLPVGQADAVIAFVSRLEQQRDVGQLVALLHCR